MIYMQDDFEVAELGDRGVKSVHIADSS